MKENELRIGNLVLDGKNRIVEVDSITELGINILHDSLTLFFEPFNPFGDEDNNDVIKPIRLTVEWLLKFGFEDVDLNMSGSNWLVKKQKGLWRQAIRIAYSEKSEEWSLTLECVSPPTLSIATIKYVHQLQNLYFALTGKEL